MPTARGTLLRTYLLGETSLIVVWCTPLGLVKTVAKGAKKPKSPFFGQLDLFFDCEISWSESKSSDLHSLKSALMLNSRLGLRSHYNKLRTASYYSKLLLSVLEPDLPCPEAHNLLERALLYLEQNVPKPVALTHFEKELAKIQGIYTPSISAHILLENHFGKLPAIRNDLLATLKASI